MAIEERLLIAAFKANHHALAEPSKTELNQLRRAIEAYEAEKDRTPAAVFFRMIPRDAHEALAKPASEPAGGVRWTVDNLLPIARRINKSGRGLVDLSALDALADELNAALSSSAGPAGEPVAWQWLCKSVLGYPSHWVLCEDAEDAASKSASGIEVRTLYAHPAPATVDDETVRRANLAYNRCRSEGDDPWDAMVAAVAAALAPATEGRKG